MLARKTFCNKRFVINYASGNTKRLERVRSRMLTIVLLCGADPVRAHNKAKRGCRQTPDRDYFRVRVAIVSH